MSFHTRSISLPSGTQSIAQKLQEELNHLKSILLLSESGATSQLVLNGFKGLVDVYALTEEVLHLPRNRKFSSVSHQRIFLEDELDMSIRVLDLCSNIRDILLESNVHDQVNGSTRKSKSQVKKAHKEIKNCLKSCKKIDNKHKDCDLSMLVETQEVTISLLEAVLSFISKPWDSKWSFVSKVVQRKRVTDNESESLLRHLMQNRVSLLNIISF